MEKAVAKNVEDILLFKKGYTKVRREGGVTREITGGARCTVSNQAESKKLTQTQSQTQSQTAIASLTALQNSSNKLIPPSSPALVAANTSSNYSQLKSTLLSKQWPNGGSLRPYQAEGIAWLYRLSIQNRPNENFNSGKNPRGAMLADEMGLGKVRWRWNTMATYLIC